MIALWVVYATVVAGVVGLAAWAVERVLRAWGRPFRHLWVGALLGSLLLPLAAATLPFSGASPAGEDADGVAGELPALVTGADAVTGGDVVAAAAPASSVMAWGVELLGPVAPRLASFDGALRAVWALATAGALLVLLLGLRAMARRRSGWTRRTVEGRPVLVAPDFGPAVVGVRRPEIVVPEWALRLERRLLQLVLLHEDAHRSAGDTALLTAGVLAVAAAPWNPFLWWQLRRLRLAVEMDCDRRVLGRGVSRVAYGRLLLEVGRRQPRPGLAVAALAEPKSFLERRIHMITTRGSNRSPLRAVVALSFAALLAVVACETPTPMELEAALDEAGMTVEDVVTLDGPGSFTFAADVLWMVDGVVVYEPSTLADFDHGQIHSIEVVKGDTAEAVMGERARGIVRITTKEAVAFEQQSEGMAVAGDRSSRALFRNGGQLRLRGILQEQEAPARTPLDSDDPPLIIVDGVITDLTMEEATALDVARVEILKGAAARAILGDRAASGVIRITTRQAGEDAPEAGVMEPSLEAAEIPSDPDATPLVFVDGVRSDVPLSELRTLDVDRIEVVKGEAAVAQLGPEAAHGIVYITTRDGGGGPR